jgi:hypothetical protein
MLGSGETTQRTLFVGRERGSHTICATLGIAGSIASIIGLGYGFCERYKRNTHDSMTFGFLRGVKTLAEGNANNVGDTSAGWKSSIKQTDDINARLQK